MFYVASQFKPSWNYLEKEEDSECEQFYKLNEQHQIELEKDFKMIQMVVIFVLILSSIGQSLEYKCERLDENVQKLCHDTGYIYTTVLPSQNGTEYKNNIYKEISRDQSLFSNCSRLSQFMVCSKYVPKCLEKEIKRVLPCKDVCERFVWDCRAKLQQNSLKDLYSGFCQLLPDRRGNASDAGCLEPQAFQRPEGKKQLYGILVCIGDQLPQERLEKQGKKKAGKEKRRGN